MSIHCKYFGYTSVFFSLLYDVHTKKKLNKLFESGRSTTWYIKTNVSLIFSVNNNCGEKKFFCDELAIEIQKKNSLFVIFGQTKMWTFVYWIRMWKKKHKINQSLSISEGYKKKIKLHYACDENDFIFLIPLLLQW